MPAGPDIALRRLCSQRLVGAPFGQAADVVPWFGAVQAQDFHGAKWALAQRTDGADDAAVQRAFDDGAILRTHVMRPTWHFVAPADIRWLLGLTAPRVHAVNASYYRKLELDRATLTRGHDIVARALAGGRHRTRTELAAALADAGIHAHGQRLAYLLMHAELDALVCSGPLRGRQFTYALLDERAPRAAVPTPDEALAELTRRYFTSHGPATVHDMRWWSGLTVADVKRGLEMVGGALDAVDVEGRTYWLAAAAGTAAGTAATAANAPIVHLLPNYDEHTVAYADHRTSCDPSIHAALRSGAKGALDVHIIVRNGLVIGGWRRVVKKRTIEVTTTLLASFSAADRAAFGRAVARYARFMGTPVSVDSGAATPG